jgi:hypothetical protein
MRGDERGSLVLSSSFPRYPSSSLIPDPLHVLSLDERQDKLSHPSFRISLARRLVAYQLAPLGRGGVPHPPHPPDPGLRARMWTY